MSDQKESDEIMSDQKEREEIMSDQRMEGSTPLKRRWSCPDTERSKALRPTLILEPKRGSPLLMLFLEEGGYRLYSPEEDRVYETKSEFSGYRFLANSGKWFLVVDSESRLCIIDVFSEERNDLPALESFRGDHFKVELLELEGTFRFNHGLIAHSSFSAGFCHTAEDLRGLLWVDEKNGDYVVVWQFSNCAYLGYCKKGDHHYREITTRVYGDRRDQLEAIRLEGVNDMVLTRYDLYILSKRDFIRHLDLSGQDGFKDVSPNHTSPMWRPAGDMFHRDEETRKVSSEDKIAVTPSQKVLIVHTRVYESKATFEKHRSFQLYEKDSTDVDSRLLEVKCLGDEALFVDLGITAPADQTLGIEPNSIYFSRGRCFSRKELSYLDICVYNLAQKTTKHFPTLSNLKLKDAQWFLPY